MTTRQFTRRFISATSFTLSTKPFRRCQSTLTPASEPSSAATLNPRWLSDVKQRIGKCLMFGMKPEKVDEAAKILQELARDWRELVAGSEGFLTSKGRAGLERQAVVWGEMDTMVGHVNNVQYVRYAESGRCMWMRNYGTYFDSANKHLWEDMVSSKNIGLILRSIKVDYKFPMSWPDRISVYHKFQSCPTESTESLVLDVMILSEVRQRPAARCLENIVVYDYRQGAKTTLAPFMLDQFVKTYELQESAKSENTRKVQSLLERVQALEKQSWDGPDAKEDFGSKGA